MKKFFAVALVLAVTGCSINISSDEHGDEGLRPQLWSDHKQLGISAESCALKGYSALKVLGFSSVVQKGEYSYGDFHANRAAVKCLANEGGSLVYVAVAGADEEIVEKLRNQLIAKL
jgi:hypothetical protein